MNVNSAINTFCFVFRLKLCHRFIKSINIEYSWYTCYCSLYWPSNSIFTTNCFLVKQEVRLKNDVFFFFLNCDGKCPNWSNSCTTKKIVFLCSNLIYQKCSVRQVFDRHIRLYLLFSEPPSTVWTSCLHTPRSVIFRFYLVSASYDFHSLLT